MKSGVEYSGCCHEMCTSDKLWQMMRLYVSAESGTVTVFQSNDTSLILLGSFVMPHAHTISVDPKTHLVYLPLENVNGLPFLRIMRPVDQDRHR